MTVFKMDFGAADFKTDPLTGEWVFLEFITNLMLAGFDAVVNGALCDEMVRYLNN